MQIANAIITNALVDELLVKSATPKPTAMGTALRYSSSHSCGRQQGYAAFEAEPSDPMDHAGAWVTGIGTIVHEALQDAISRRFPGAQFEFPSQVGGFVSGSCDALIPVSEIGEYSNITSSGTHVLFELKTMGTYSFDKQVGWNRTRSTQGREHGPALKAIAQAGMNAIGIMTSNPDIFIEDIVMGSITFEGLSKNKAFSMGVTGSNRVLAEFWIPRYEWEHLASEELERMGEIFSVVDSGFLPDRVAIDDEGDKVLLDPSGRAWQCDYCSFKRVCKQDGERSIRITESVATPRKKESDND
jgi:DNA-directed RNA polymerase subunit RPC12/RpoP